MFAWCPTYFTSVRICSYFVITWWICMSYCCVIVWLRVSVTVWIGWGCTTWTFPPTCCWCCKAGLLMKFWVGGGLVTTMRGTYGLGAGLGILLCVWVGRSCSLDPVVIWYTLWAWFCIFACRLLLNCAAYCKVTGRTLSSDRITVVLWGFTLTFGGM